MKCNTYRCQNHDDEGNGIYFRSDSIFGEIWFCIPCWEFITEGVGRYSQVYRNILTALDPKVDKNEE
jgi:hypothetical protein